MNLKNICRKIVERPNAINWLDQEHLISLIKEAADCFMKEKNIIRLSGSVLFAGDIHGDIDAMVSALRIAEDRNSKVVFLGDIVDRGSRQAESINLLLAQKLLQPDNVFYIRGNHEFKEVNSTFGFADAVLDKYSETIYWLYNTCFSTLPLTVLLSGKIFGIHGGVCKHVPTLKALESIERPSLSYADERLGIIWNDPSESEPGFGYNRKRGIFFTYGKEAFDEFMGRNNLELMIRAHEPWPDGYKYFFDKRLVSVFSCKEHYKIKPKAVLVKEDGEHEILGL